MKIFKYLKRMIEIVKAKFKGDKIMITLNQEEIQLACKRFAKEQYNLELPDTENPAHGIQLKVITNDMHPGTARIEADIETK